MTTDRKRKATSSSSDSAPAKKSPRKTVTRKVPAKNTAESSSTADGSDQPTRSRASAPRAESRPRPAAAEVAKKAVEQLAGLTGKAVEGVTGVERTDDGWRVTAEVLEVRRIPETTDVLAQYEIETDDMGELMSYRRARRYTRGSALEG